VTQSIFRPVRLCAENSRDRISLTFSVICFFFSLHFAPDCTVLRLLYLLSLRRFACIISLSLLPPLYEENFLMDKYCLPRHPVSPFPASTSLLLTVFPPPSSIHTPPLENLIYLQISSGMTLCLLRAVVGSTRFIPTGSSPLILFPPFSRNYVIV